MENSTIYPAAGYATTPVQMKSSIHMENLKEKLVNFFRTEEFTIEQIPGGASSRCYFKLKFRSTPYFPTSTILLMTIPRGEIKVLEDYFNIDNYLRRMKVSTPRIYEINLSHGWIFLELKEIPTLMEYLQANPRATEHVIPKTIDFLVDIQKKCHKELNCPAFRRRFDYEKYMFEFNFHFQEQLLLFYFKRPFDQKAMRSFSHEISSTLDIALPLFVHRDFQSSNIFYDHLYGNGDEFCIIDFQDARHGSPIYDVISCLWDSYIFISDEFREELLEIYYRRLPDFGIEWEWGYYQKLVDYTVIQRKLHDAGAFAYNFRRFNSTRYLCYISEAFDMVLQKISKYPHFSSISRILEKLQYGE